MPKYTPYINTKYMPKASKAPGTGEIFAANLKKAWETAKQPKGYCNVENPTIPFSNKPVCGARDEVGFKFQFWWFEPKKDEYTFEFGTNFGKGVAYYLDGEYLLSNTANLWWNNDWKNKAVIKLTIPFSAGLHNLLMYA